MIVPIIFVLCSLMAFGSSADTPYSGPTWQEQPAKAKFLALQSAITSDVQSGSWPSTLEEAELFIESMDPSFDTVADDLPYQGLFDWQRRPKLIHSVGCIAPAQFVSNGQHNYTGMFQGADFMFIRWSTATAFSDSPRSMVPAVSLKFLRDQMFSSNVMAMYSLEGQDSFNIFKHDLTNHVPDLSSDANSALYLVRDKFATASAFPVMLGLSSIANYTQSGNPVNNPEFPFKIILQPIQALKTMFPDNYTTADLCSLLQQVPVGPIYKVYAQQTPTATPERIGCISITGSITGSYFADTYMFFQHGLFEDDLLIHPEWTDAANQIMQTQENTPYFNGYPDLPDTADSC